YHHLAIAKNHIPPTTSSHRPPSINFLQPNKWENALISLPKILSRHPCILLREFIALPTKPLPCCEFIDRDRE
ncbi:unnamed protein product, partial [Prunus brigantina]